MDRYAWGKAWKGTTALPAGPSRRVHPKTALGTRDPEGNVKAVLGWMGRHLLPGGKGRRRRRTLPA